MPVFHLHFRGRLGTKVDPVGLEFANLEDAYLNVCASVGDAAQEVILQGEDPLQCVFVIADRAGRTLMEIPFAEVLCPAHWRRSSAPARPADSPRSNRTRVQLARDVFMRTLGESPIAHALVGLDFELLSVNEAALGLTNERTERLLGNCVFETFEGFQGVMPRKLEAFYGLAVRGLKARVNNLFYKQPGRTGAESSFWTQALAWPIHDDDGRVLAVINCAVGALRPLSDGECKVLVGHHDA